MGGKKWAKECSCGVMDSMAVFTFLVEFDTDCRVIYFSDRRQCQGEMITLESWWSSGSLLFSRQTINSPGTSATVGRWLSSSWRWIRWRASQGRASDSRDLRSSGLKWIVFNGFSGNWYLKGFLIHFVHSFLWKTEANELSREWLTVVRDDPTDSLTSLARATGGTSNDSISVWSGIECKRPR